MRRFLVGGVAGLFLVLAALTGCDSKGAATPKVTIDVPTEGPIPVSGGKKGKETVPGGQGSVSQ